MRVFYQTKTKLSNELGREPSPEELAKLMNVSLVEVVKIQRANNLNRVDSIDKQIGEEGFSLLNLLLTTRQENYPENTAEKEELIRVIYQALELLGNTSTGVRQRNVLSLRFGLGKGGGRPRTLEEVSQIFGVSRERIRQIEVGGIRRLRRNQKARQLLRDFLEA